MAGKPMKTEKRMEESLTEQIQLLMPQHINGSGRLFGGRLLEWIDVVGGVTARRHSECDVITAAIDNLQFKEGAYVNDTLVLLGRITYVGNTSMEVRVDTYVEDLSGIRRPINRAYMVFVALDKEGKPTRVPRLIIDTESQRGEWEGAIKRNELRKVRRKEGY
jgi:acyl-CoA hydrolase